MNRWLKFLIAMVTVSALAACGGDDDDPPPAAQQPGNIAEVAQANGFTALLAAVNKAGIASALTDANAKLTVFAPTDDAFKALATQLGFSDANALVAALPPTALANILTYHVLPSQLSAAQLSTGGATQATLYSFEGKPATVTVAAANGGVTVTDAALTSAKVGPADVQASNGVIHVVDKVLVPPGVLNIVQMAQVNPVFSTLVGAVVATDLVGDLSGAGPLTVFAPTNDAFAAIQATVAGLTTAQLKTVLTYHVLPAQVLAADIPFGQPVTTAAGQDIVINAGTPPTITDSTGMAAPIVATDVRASNGVIHVISKVLIPNLNAD